MKISELKNAPQWLLDADTEDADVSIDLLGRVQWAGGNFWGGDFRGGNFWGGDFRGGNFWGGDFRGGNFLGGNFLGGDFWGEKLKEPPATIYGLKWPVTVSANQMRIGCQRHTHAAWAMFTDREINGMDTGALKFWRRHKDGLMAVCAMKALKRQ